MTSETEQNTFTFHVRVNGGVEQAIEVRTGIYRSAAAAVPALLGLADFPMQVTIWVPDLVPQYGPYDYVVREPGGAAIQVAHRADPPPHRDTVPNRV